MLIDNLITEYISGNKRLVVPDFGAFIRKDTGIVVFMEFLKKDDGVLITYLCSKLSLTPGQASESIIEYVAALKKDVAERGSHVIEGLGKMTVDANGLYQLIYDPSVKEAGTTVAAQAPREKPAADIITERAAAPAVTAKSTPREQSVPNLTLSDTQPVRPTPTPTAERATVVRDQQPAIEYKEAESSAPKTLNDFFAPKTTVSDAAQRGEAPLTAKEPEPRQKTQAESLFSTPAKTPSAPPAAPPRPRPAGSQPVNYRSKKNRMDLIMIIAIVAALIAVGSMIYGLLVNNDPLVNLQPTSPTEMVDQPLDDVSDTDTDENQEE